MIIYNYAITEFDVQRDLLLSELSRRGYSDATILGYKEYLNCVKKYFQQKQKSIFTNEDEPTRDRLKASELLAKAKGMFNNDW
jgi:hypothetical protein